MKKEKEAARKSATPFRTWNWGVMKNHPTDLMGEMADELLKKEQWAEDGHYLCGESRQGDVTLRLFVSVHPADGAPRGDAMADIIVEGYEPVTTNSHDVMFTYDEKAPLAFDLDARDELYNEIEAILAEEGNFKVLN